jgi:hypothetical protein
MKQIAIFFLFAACIWLQSCQPNTTAQISEAAVKPLTHKESLDTLLANESAKIVPVSYNLNSALEREKVVAKINIPGLFHTKPGDYYSVYNGFYGEDHYRIEFAFLEAGINPINQNEILVSGKTRFKKNIAPFTGKLIIDSLYTITDTNLDSSDMANMEINQIVELAGHFEIKEDTAAAGSGQFTGLWHLTLSLHNDGTADIWYASRTNTKSAGLLLEGQWTSYRSGKTKPFLLANDLFMVADDVLENFSVGEREVEINPKYHALGWDKFWDNEEWWAGK